MSENEKERPESECIDHFCPDLARCHRCGFETAHPDYSEPVNTHGVGAKHCGRLGCELCMEAKRKQTEKEKAK